MGTRNLTIVISEGKTKVAQYGQWDGYPGGQGSTILQFLKTNPIGIFKSQLEKVRFTTNEDEKEIDTFMLSIGCKDGWMNNNQARQYHDAYPYFSRDHAAKILDMIMRSDGEVILQDQTYFAADSLMCEWAYVIDLDGGFLEVYSGFNKTDLDESERFSKLPLPERSGEYKQIKMIKKYSFDDLPEVDVFIKELEGQEEEADS